MRVLLLISTVFILLTGCERRATEQALGTLERERITFIATSSELIRALPVKEGRHVESGDILVVLDNQKQLAVLAQAKAGYDKAHARLLSLTNGERPEDIAAAKAESDRAKANLIASEKNYNRVKNLFTKRLVSAADRDTALAAKDAAMGSYNLAKEHLAKLMAGARIENIAEAQAELDAAEALLSLQQQKLDELTISATRSGILEQLPYHLGERVAAGALVAIVEAEHAPYARVYIPAAYRLNFPIAAKVSVFVDGLEAPFEGAVRWVATAPSFTPYYALTENERSRLVYLAEIDLPESAKNLPSGIGAQLDLSNQIRVSND